MTNMVRSNTITPDPIHNQPRWPEKRALHEISTEPIRVAGKAHERLDPKTEQMIELLLNEEFTSPRALNQLRLKLALWVIRNQILIQAKRAFDIVFSLAALICLSPVFLITAIAIKLDTPGPVFFKQVRVGKRGKEFSCYKFRSMVINADAMKKDLLDKNEADEIVFKMRNDPRITRVGRIIRKLSIDELPQFLNVLEGYMSIVGPRPPVPIEVEYYNYTQYHRLDVVPGITGLQQIEGRAGITFKRWVELDLEYIEKQGLKKDLEIVLRTIPAVISRKGAF